MTLSVLTDSVNNCYHLPEGGHSAEKDGDDDSWDKKGLLCEQQTKNVNSDQLYINRQSE